MKLNKLLIICAVSSFLIILFGIIFQNSKFHKFELNEIEAIQAYNLDMQEKMPYEIKEKILHKRFIKESKIIWEKIKNNTENNLWQIYNDVRITPSGAISAAKLKGTDEVNKYLETKGKYNPKDENGDTLSKFFAIDAGDSLFDVTGIEYKDNAFNVYQIIDWHKNSNKKAQEVIYNFLLENEKGLDIKNELGGNEKNRIIATFIDLNDDNKNEVIGYIEHIYYSAKFESEFNLFILEKQTNGKYKNISNAINIGVLRPLYILNSKNEGYRDIFCYNSGRSNINQFNLKYQNKFYSYDFDSYLTKSTEKI